MEGTRVRFSEPNCDLVLGGGSSGGAVVPKCEEAKAKAEASGNTPVECDVDGFFKDKQCALGWFSTSCWCVNQDGEEIEGTKGDTDVQCLRVPGKQSKSLRCSFILFSFNGFTKWWEKMTQNQKSSH